MSTSGARDRFVEACGFELDRFQIEALDTIDEGRSVLVAAPTGSGKTVVAEYAVHRTLADGGRIFYTTPIKALSNQKYRDLVRQHGSDLVGLLTGDNVINPSAPVVVMTTEVLRNMIYARSDALVELRWVVLDEVHYLQDRYRGPVWEEVIIHAAPEVGLVCLSATVSNAEEVAEWISTVRGPTDVISELSRPVELINHYLVGDHHHARLHFIDTLPEGRPNPDGSRFDVALERGRRGPGGGRRRWYTPRRVEVIELLAERKLLPAITFIFSRAGCDAAVRACLDAGLRLTTGPERRRIHEVVEQRVSGMSDDDLAVLGYDRWLAGLDAGLAAHHAGMVPPFKEAVETLFTEGLVKAVFATETLALGINMPARSVVIEKLSKYSGERHESLTPGEYTQLTGRAGRRGIDEVGHAVVLWSPFVTFDEVARLASSRSFELSSAFRPTYNMAANLVRRYDPDEAVELIGRSFAQFRTDRSVVALGRRLDDRSRSRERAEAEAQCELGDVREFRSLQQEAKQARRPAPAPEAEVAAAMAGLRPGDVLMAPRGTGGGTIAVLSVAERRGGGVRVKAVGQPRHLLTLGPRDFATVPEVVGRVELPEPFTPTKRPFVNEVRRRLRRADIVPPDRSPSSGGDEARPTGEKPARTAVRDHPVARCPELDRHLRALRRIDRIDREAASLDRRLEHHATSLSSQFEALLGVLEAWGHLDRWHLTAAGELLARVYHECDLLVAECLHRGLLDELDPPTLAGVVASFTYEHRSSQPPPDPYFPPGPMRQRVGDIARVARRLNRDETAAGISLTRPPDPGFSALAHGWASGGRLGDVLGEELITGGDFVRNVKNLIDLLRQIGHIAPDPDTATAARQAAEALFRGVIASSSAVTAPESDTSAASTGGGEVGS
ncbi:MAG: DEAD/DEAH box helicase [Acidimicrobiales bacterium]